MSRTVVVAGSLNLDWVGQAPRIPGPGETVLGSHLASFHGGKGGNQAVAAARMGAPVRMHAAVGDDAAGTALRDGLVGEGVDATGVVAHTGVASGAALITVAANGENAITVLPGANLFAPQPPANAFTGAAVLVLQMEIPLATNLQWAVAARAQGAVVILNAAPMPDVASLAPEAAAQWRALLGQVDWLVLNESELALLMAEPGLSATSAKGLDGAAAQVLALGPRGMLLTLGAHGCKAWNPGHQWTAPGHAINVVDTTGAGDTFVGTFAAGLSQGQSVDVAIGRANAAAALSCTRAGARGGMPTVGLVDGFLNMRA